MAPRSTHGRTGLDGPAPRWLSGLSDEALRRRVGPDTFGRGLAYAGQGAVETIAAGDDGRLLLTAVRGSGARTYQTVIQAGTDADGGLLDWTGRCTCPMGYDCKHVVAVLTAARERAAAAGPRLPDWEARLAELVPQEPPRTTPLALQVEVVAATATAPYQRGRADRRPRLQLRPVVRGASGRWVRSGVGWRDLELGHQQTLVRPDQREALAAISLAARGRTGQPVSYGDVQIHLDQLGSAGWRLLRALADVDVPLVPRTGIGTDGLPRRVEIAKPAEVELDVRRAPGGGAEVRAIADVPGEADLGAAAHLIGEPASGLFLDQDERLLLVPFETGLDPAVARLLAGEPVRIPATDVPRFLSTYYPALRQRLAVRSGDGSVALPVVTPPLLALQVRFEAAHETVLRWGFRYDLGGTTHQVPLGDGGAPEVVRDRTAEQALLQRLERSDAHQLLHVPSQGRPVLVERRLSGLQTAAFVADLLPALQDHPDVVVEVRGEPVAYRESQEQPSIAVSTRESPGAGPADWFDLDIDVSVGGEQVPMAALIAALTNGEQHLILDSGTWFRVDRPELTALRRLVEEARDLQDSEHSGGLQLTPWQAGLWEELVSLGVVEQQSERWRRTVGALLDVEQLPRPDPPAMLRAELRPYQLAGYHWLALLWDHRLGGVLADDMGLGKTLQTLAMAARAHEQGTLTAPLLIVAPTSVVATWAAEAAKFCPGLRVATMTGTERRGGPLAGQVAGAQVAVTSYALLRIDEEAYRAVTWSGLVLDEAQFVKNYRAKTYQCARRLEAPFKLAITGTPLENSLMDLWALLSITAPGLFPSPQRFTTAFRRPIESGESPELLATLRRRVRPLMLRRTKEQVAPELPPKVEQTLAVTLAPAHRRVYDRHLQRERQRVLGLIEDLQHNRIAIFRSLTLLRQLSLDASLVDPAHAQTVPSSKIDALMDQLTEVVAEGHRALVFSQFTGFLALVRDRITAAGMAHCYLDGRTRDRAARIAEFTGGDAPVFLISLKAGGFGLTLTEADYVFVLDPWWNPAAEDQAVDRTHRIGQSRTVMVYRLVATDTIEEKVVALQERKRDLFSRVVDDEAMPGAGLSAQDILGLFEA